MASGGLELLEEVVVEPSGRAHASFDLLVSVTPNQLQTTGNAPFYKKTVKHDQTSVYDFDHVLLYSYKMVHVLLIPTGWLPSSS